MTILFSSSTLAYAVVEYLKTSNHICELVETKPTQDKQYRIVFLALHAADAVLAVRLLSFSNEVTNSRYHYSVVPTAPDYEKAISHPPEKSPETI